MYLPCGLYKYVGVTSYPKGVRSLDPKRPLSQILGILSLRDPVPKDSKDVRSESSKDMRVPDLLGSDLLQSLRPLGQMLISL